MNRTTKTISAIGATAGLIIGAGLVAAPANADSDRGNERSDRGMCRSGAVWDLDVDREYGWFEVDFDIDGARPGDQYRVTVTLNDRTVTTRTIRADYEGDVDFTGAFRSQSGSQRIGVQAVSTGGDLCSGSVQFGSSGNTNSGRDMERSDQGLCRLGAMWDLDVEREFGRLNVDFNVDGARPWERYKVTVKINDRTKVTRTVRADYEGDVDFDRSFRDRSGPDRVSVQAVSSRGDACNGAVRI